MKKFGFTLAEILITLGVIGVVSAITLPLIHSKIQDYILKNRFKKVYNTYASAIQMINTENGGIYECYYISGVNAKMSDCYNFFTSLSTQLKYTKYCSGQAFKKGCIPEYSKYYPEDAGTACYGFKKSIVNYSSRAWILNDGSIIFTYSNGTAPLFAVDINGLAKPNKGGYDLFTFKLVKSGDTIKLDDINCQGSFKENDGKTVKEMLLN